MKILSNNIFLNFLTPFVCHNKALIEYFKAFFGISTFQTKVGTQIVRWVYLMGLEAYKRKRTK